MHGLRLAMAMAVAIMSALAISPASAQSQPAAQLLESVATAMGGRDRLLGLQNLVYTGFGQQAYFDGGGNITGEPHAPPKWRAVADAQRTIDLAGERALSQERRSFMFPFAAPFGITWNRVGTAQTAPDLLDHPLPAVRAALRPGARLDGVSVEQGIPVLQFTTAGGIAVALGVDPITRLPRWSRRVIPHVNLGDVALTAYFSGYAPYGGVQLPLGLMHRYDWRDQITLMFQVDSYRLDVPTAQLPAFPAAAARPEPPAPQATVVPLAKGVWDVRVGSNGGPVIEFADHLLMFEAGGSAAATIARIDAANALVPGKRVSGVIVSHHHFDHTAGLRAAVSRGLGVISHRGNEGIVREMIERAALVYPDELAKSPYPLRFTPVDERLVLEDSTQRLELYRVVEHSHMAHAVFGYLPASRIMMEGDLGDEAWNWHWWAGAMAANLRAYNLEPRLNVAVHGPAGGLSMEQTMANTQRQAQAAQRFCEEQLQKGITIFGCPVQYDTSGPLPLAPR